MEKRIRSLISKLTLKEVIELKKKVNKLFKEQEEIKVLNSCTCKEKVIQDKKIYEKRLESARQDLRDIIPDLTEEQKKLLHERLEETIREELVQMILKLDRNSRYAINQDLINMTRIKEDNSIKVRHKLLYIIPILTSLIVITQIVRKGKIKK